MIDGIKLNIKNKDYAKRLQENKLFEFESIVNNSTGELSNKVETEYKNLKITIYESGTVIIKGSLHKFWNSGNHNYNDFYLTNVLNIIDEWVNLFGTEILNAKIDNIEFGVNINPPINTTDILRNITLHKRKEFKTGTFKNSYYKECEHKHFYIKTYDKARQYNQPKDILRIECKYIKMVELNRLGVYLFKDLKKTEIYPKLRHILIDKWNEVLFIDETIKRKELTGKQSKSFNNFINPNYWIKIAKNKKSYLFNKELCKYQNTVSNHSDNLQLKISNLINEKWQKLTDILKAEKTKTAKINHLYIGLNFAKTSKRCLITGLSIDMQKDNSILLSHTGLKFYYKNNPDIFQQIKYKYLSKEWINSDFETQIKEIAHNIRNYYNNRRLKQIRLYPENQYRLSF